MQKIYENIALAYFTLATLTLMLFSIVLFVSAVWTVAAAVAAYDPVDEVLDSIGLLIIGFAVIETSKFIAEEEILRKRELRSALESRRSLTKFITIIVIAASLEALVMVFKTSRTNIPDALYPAALFVAAMFALTALGAYQFLSSRIDKGGRSANRPKRRKTG
ncbi:MAG: hypothetical protein AB7U38_03010 [Hyphomicrobiales bacterium]